MVAICAVEEKDQGLRMELRGTPMGRGYPQEEAATGIQRWEENQETTVGEKG